MEEVVQETAAEVAALIPKYSWELMDEEQKDALMSEVVLPRYGKTTRDGVKMGPTWWGELIGATMSAVESRVRRLRSSQIMGETESATTLDQVRIRDARSSIRKAPAEVVAALDPETKAGLTQALIEDSPEKVARAVTATIKTTPAAIAAAPVDSELWDWPQRMRSTARAHLSVISEFPSFIDAYGSRIHKTSDGEEFTGSELGAQVLDEVKGELDLGYSNVTGENAVDEAISQILA